MAERRKGTHRAEVLLWSILGTAVAGLAFGGWSARDYLDRYAAKAHLLVVEAKADFILDQQLAAIIGQIAYLERKQRKTQEEINQLNFLRQQLAIMRSVRAARQ